MVWITGDWHEGEVHSLEEYAKFDKRGGFTRFVEIKDWLKKTMTVLMIVKGK